MPRRARLAGLLLLALLACAPPASADSPVSDQYLSAPPPVTADADRPPATRPAATSAAPGTTATPAQAAPGSTGPASAGARTPPRGAATPPAPLVVERDTRAGARAEQPLATPGSHPPIVALAGLGLLALALALGAATRGRRPAAMP